MRHFRETIDSQSYWYYNNELYHVTDWDFEEPDNYDWSDWTPHQVMNVCHAMWVVRDQNYRYLGLSDAWAEDIVKQFNKMVENFEATDDDYYCEEVKPKQIEDISELNNDWDFVFEGGENYKSNPGGRIWEIILRDCLNKGALRISADIRDDYFTKIGWRANKAGTNNALDFLIDDRTKPLRKGKLFFFETFQDKTHDLRFDNSRDAINAIAAVL